MRCKTSGKKQHNMKRVREDNITRPTKAQKTEKVHIGAILDAHVARELNRIKNKSVINISEPLECTPMFLEDVRPLEVLGSVAREQFYTLHERMIICYFAKHVLYQINTEYIICSGIEINQAQMAVIYREKRYNGIKVLSLLNREMQYEILFNHDSLTVKGTLQRIDDNHLGVDFTQSFYIYHIGDTKATPVFKYNKTNPDFRFSSTLVLSSTSLANTATGGFILSTKDNTTSVLNNQSTKYLNATVLRLDEDLVIQSTSICNIHTKKHVKLLSTEEKLTRSAYYNATKQELVLAKNVVALMDDNSLAIWDTERDVCGQKWRCRGSLVLLNEFSFCVWSDRNINIFTIPQRNIRYAYQKQLDRLFQISQFHDIMIVAD
jgi:hypothetical protein